MITIILTQAYDEDGRKDFETEIDRRTVAPSEVPSVLYEFTRHHNNESTGELIVCMSEPDCIHVTLYNGYVE